MNCEYIIQYIKRYGNHSLINLSNIENRDEIKCYNLKMIAHQNVEKYLESQRSTNSLYDWPEGRRSDIPGDYFIIGM